MPVIGPMPFVDKQARPSKLGGTMRKLASIFAVSLLSLLHQPAFAQQPPPLVPQLTGLLPGWPNQTVLPFTLNPGANSGSVSCSPPVCTIPIPLSDIPAGVVPTFTFAPNGGGQSVSVTSAFPTITSQDLNSTNTVFWQDFVYRAGSSSRLPITNLTTNSAVTMPQTNTPQDRCAAIPGCAQPAQPSQ
jgi:hypothetical protein